MAKGKKSKGTHYESKGLIGSNKKLRNAMRRDRSPFETLNNKWNAYFSGKKVYMTIQNPNPKETNKRFIRVPMNELYGTYTEFLKNRKIPMKHETE